MGSSASASVQRIHGGKSDVHDITENSAENETKMTKRLGTFHHKNDAKISPVKSEVTEVSPELKRYEELLMDAEERAKSAEQKAQNIELQMAELEIQKLELMDQVAELEQHVESLQKTANADDWTNTLQAKDQYIEYLEGQVQKGDTQIITLKKKFQKKLRLLKRELSETKQSQSVMSLEQQQERQNLIEENNKLKDWLRRLPTDASIAESDISDSRTKIILELSSRVSEQDSRINDLQSVVDEKENEICSLQARIKDLEETALNKNSSDSSKRQKYISSRTAIQSNRSSQHPKKIADSTQDDEMLNELKSLTEEMKDLWNKEARDEKDYRQSSGISRDSGIMTAAPGTLTGNNDSDWADSDVEIEASDKCGDQQPSIHCEDSSNSKTVNCNINEKKDELYSDQRTVLDPLSIRQISAAKLRKQRTRLHGKPPLQKDNFRFGSETDHLFNGSENIAIKRSEPLQVL